MTAEVVQMSIEDSDSSLAECRGATPEDSSLIEPRGDSPGTSAEVLEMLVCDSDLPLTENSVENEST